MVQSVPRSWFERCGTRHGQTCKRLIVSLPNAKPVLPISLDTFDLVNADGCLQIHHIIFVSDLNHIIVVIADIGEPLPSIF